MRRALIVAAFLPVLAACSGGGGNSSPPPTATHTLTGSAAYLADVRHAGLGNKDVTTTSDDSLISLGNTECRGLGSGQSYGAAVETLTGAGQDITTAQADMLVRSAVRNLCPDQASMLP